MHKWKKKDLQINFTIEQRHGILRTVYKSFHFSPRSCSENTVVKGDLYFILYGNANRLWIVMYPIIPTLQEQAISLTQEMALLFIDQTSLALQNIGSSPPYAR